MCNAPRDLGTKAAPAGGGEIRVGFDGDDAVAHLEIERRVLALVQAEVENQIVRHVAVLGGKRR
jgi:hypothetical protein